MAIILKDKTADFSQIEGAEKLYLDALTTEGTLLLHDYSRMSCLPDGTIEHNSPIIDLGSMGEDTVFKSNSELMKDDDYLDALTKSYLLRNVGANGGINLGRGIQQYLYEKNPEKVLFIIWMYSPYEEHNRDFGFTLINSLTDSGVGNNFIFRVTLVGHGHATISVCGLGAQPIQFKNTLGEFRQLAVVYERGKKNATFRNAEKVFSDSLTENNYNWPKPSSDLFIANQTNDGYSKTDVKIARILIEDLSKSGRDERDVISMDFDYVNGTGAFTGIEPRPYSRVLYP